jgi:hypothetical protein
LIQNSVFSLLFPPKILHTDPIFVIFLKVPAGVAVLAATDWMDTTAVMAVRAVTPLAVPTPTRPVMAAVVPIQTVAAAAAETATTARVASQAPLWASMRPTQTGYRAIGPTRRKRRSFSCRGRKVKVVPMAPVAPVGWAVAAVVASTASVVYLGVAVVVVAAVAVVVVVKEASAPWAAAAPRQYMHRIQHSLTLSRTAIWCPRHQGLVGPVALAALAVQAAQVAQVRHPMHQMKSAPVEMAVPVESDSQVGGGAMGPTERLFLFTGSRHRPQPDPLCLTSRR